MHRTIIFAAAASAALLALAGCHNQVETVNTYDPQAEALKNAPPVALPPAVTSSKAYRCADNSLFYVDFYDNHTAMIRRTTRQAAPTALTATDGNPPFTGQGFTLSGTGDNVSINGKSCHT